MRTHHRHYVAPEPLPLFEPPGHGDLLKEYFAAEQRLMDIIDRNINPPAQPVETSIAAAQKIAPAVSGIRRKIYDYLVSQGARGATAGEITEALGLNPSTVRPRLIELCGNAVWAKGQLKRLIGVTWEVRGGMRVYIAL